ncbi:protein of unknown function [Dethiosulfatibacter aminovorans DSM 17477]|uniref:DUF4317 domain-containing protein n=1 Tax=Dethiosulfatibacter aminovorans DSM 17477 TaxID=1121476 RepID=A0A1M6JTX2_9FIRM|nr:DUF4317 domain-containing protein [Dethiosulfatibacter aminovorans]SHJ50143.1 protein of unknown function [Dethiosulfatibacter aminovorans DSM 17477]
MNRKDILELKRRFKKDHCTFTKLCGCYVNGEKETVLEFRETFLNLPEEEFYKYLEISKKILSGTIDNNLLELNFPLDENFNNEKQDFFMQLKKSGLKDDALLRKLYDSIIESYDYAGNFLILVFHDVYDVMTKTTDNIKIDESEEIYEYIMCAICPVSLSKPGLGYFAAEREIKARIRDWVVEVPSIGFVFPGFVDRSSDVNTVMYYTKNAKDPHSELMENTLGCLTKQTATIQKETFQSIIKSTVSPDDEISEKVYADIQENLNAMVEEYNEVYEDTDAAPITLTKDKVKELLIDSGVPEEVTEKIGASYDENFGENPPLAESLIDSKLVKANAQKKKEEQLIEQVEKLEQKLEEVTKITETEDDSEVKDEPDTIVEDNPPAVVLHVKPDKLPMIKTELINGQRCIVVPMDDDEQATINGMKDMF